VNETIHLHGVIHRYNPHIVAVAHTHPPNVVTWTTFRKLPDTYDQESCLLADDIAIVDEEFTGLAQSEDRVRPFAQALGKKPVVLLPNHGVSSAAQATGLVPHAIKPEHALTTKNELAKIPILDALWEDLLKRLRQTDAGLFQLDPKSSGLHSRSEALSA
jgi:hypothetical protein